MNTSESPNRRRRRPQLNPELLEDRSLMTGGAGSMFAVVNGDITTAYQPAQVKFTIDPSHFTIPKGSFTLGIDVVAASGSSVKPQIYSVDDAGGKVVKASHAIYDKAVQRSNTSSGPQTSAVLTTVGFPKKNPNGSQTYTVNVVGMGGTTGNFLLGFYLPGDANGDGKVDTTDIKTIKSELRLNGNSTKYTFDADANRDGKISMTDVAVATKNMGVSTNISPTATANLDPANDPGVSKGTVKASPVHYTGVATPGAKVMFQGTNTGDQPVATLADAKGNYSLYIPVDKGENVFKVTTQDGFGQSIVGTITPVTMLVSPAVTPATTPTTAKSQVTSTK